MNIDRILPSQVTLSNLEAFKEQVRRDLPLGTPQANVEAYLRRWNIPYDFFGPLPIYGPDGNSFRGKLSNIGRLDGYEVDLAIWIYLDANEKVERVEFRLNWS